MPYFQVTMEAGIFPWTPFDTTFPWAVPPVTMATSPVWTTPSDFAVSGTAAPAIQAVMTLNLTSNSDLNNLLAGLLANNTVGANGNLGVNGSFLPVTDYLPSLGLNSVVMGSLANEILPSGGVFGLPISEATVPPSPPPCSWSCSLWNSVSGVVTNLVGTVLSVAGAVWTAAVGAVTYFNNLVPGLAALEEAAADAAVGWYGSSLGKWRTGVRSTQE